MEMNCKSKIKSCIPLVILLLLILNNKMKGTKLNLEFISNIANGNAPSIFYR